MEAFHRVAPLQPPPPPFEGEDAKSSSRLPEANKRTVPDGGLDVSVDLGEAVARTPALTGTPAGQKARPSSPMLLDYMSSAHDASFAPVVRVRQPGVYNKLDPFPFLYSNG